MRKASRPSPHRPCIRFHSWQALAQKAAVRATEAAQSLPDAAGLGIAAADRAGASAVIAATQRRTLRSALCPVSVPANDRPSTAAAEITSHPVSGSASPPPRPVPGRTTGPSPGPGPGPKKGYTETLSALAGANRIYRAAGMDGSTLRRSLESFEADNDTVGSVRRAARSIEVSRGTLSPETIREDCRDGPGHFPDHDRSRGSMQSDRFYLALADRRTPLERRRSEDTDLCTSAPASEPGNCARLRTRTASRRRSTRRPASASRPGCRISVPEPENPNRGDRPFGTLRSLYNRAFRSPSRAPERSRGTHRRERTSMPQSPNAQRSSRTDDARFPYGFRPAGRILEPMLQANFAPQVLAVIRIRREWARIVDGDLANHCRPLHLRHDGRGAVLHVHADNAWSTEFLHREKEILERIRTSCGTGSVDRIRITQVGYDDRRKTMRRGSARPPARRTAGPAPANRAVSPRSARQLATVRNPDLRAALEQLHAAVRGPDRTRTSHLRRTST